MLKRLSLTGGIDPGRTRTIIVDPKEVNGAEVFGGKHRFILREGNVALHREQIRLLRSVGLSLAREEYAGEPYGCFYMPEHLAGMVTSISDHNTLAFLIKRASGISRQPKHIIDTFSDGLRQYRSMLMDGGVLFLQCREDAYFIDDRTDQKIPMTRLILHAGFRHVEEKEVDDVWDVPFPAEVLARFNAGSRRGSVYFALD